MKIIDITLPNGYNVQAIEQSKCIIDEIWEKKLYERHFTISAGMTIIDIGANQGFFSLYAAAKGASVIAYEPEKTNFRLLHENVRRNGLFTMVRCVNKAVGGTDGKLSLYVPDYDQPSASGLVTSCKDFFYKNVLNDLCPDGSACEIQEAPCTTLAAILSAGDTVDLLKMDCEGAELEILATVSIDAMRGVKNIVMETHNTYKAAEMYWRLRELGFSVLSFERPSGKMQHCLGYVLAKNNLEPNVISMQEQNPVAVISMAGSVLVNDSISGNAIDSFSLQNRDAPLTVRWFVDDDSDSAAEGLFFNHVFRQTGMYPVTIEVSDGLSTTRIQRTVWVFYRDYFRCGDVIALPADTTTVHLAHETQFYAIKNESIPLSHEYDKIVIGFSVEKHPGEIKLLFNGETTMLPEGYSEKEFQNYPYFTDLHFAIAVTASVKLGMKWWTCNNSCAEIDATIIDKFHSRSIRPLSKCGGSERVTVQGSMQFGIHKSMLPDGWMPEQICIGVTRCAEDGSTKMLSLSVSHGAIHRTVGGYTEIRTARQSIHDEILLTIDVSPGKEIVKIGWWCE